MMHSLLMSFMIFLVKMQSRFWQGASFPHNFMTMKLWDHNFIDQEKLFHDQVLLDLAHPKRDIQDIIYAISCYTLVVNLFYTIAKQNSEEEHEVFIT